MTWARYQHHDEGQGLEAHTLALPAYWEKSKIINIKGPAASLLTFRSLKKKNPVFPPSPSSGQMGAKDKTLPWLPWEIWGKSECSWHTARLWWALGVPAEKPPHLSTGPRRFWCPLAASAIFIIFQAWGTPGLSEGGAAPHLQEQRTVGLSENCKGLMR